MAFLIWYSPIHTNDSDMVQYTKKEYIGYMIGSSIIVAQIRVRVHFI